MCLHHAIIQSHSPPPRLHSRAPQREQDGLCSSKKNAPWVNIAPGCNIPSFTSMLAGHAGDTLRPRRAACPSARRKCLNLVALILTQWPLSLGCLQGGGTQSLTSGG